RLLPVGRKSLPEVFAYEIVSLKDGESGLVGEGAIPVAIDADNGVRVAIEDLLQVTDGLVAPGFGALESGDVAVVEGDAVVGRKDVDVHPHAEGFAKVLDLLGDASVHGVVMDAFEIGAQRIGEEFPVGFAVDVGWLDTD